MKSPDRSFPNRTPLSTASRVLFVLFLALGAGLGWVACGDEETTAPAPTPTPTPTPTPAPEPAAPSVPGNLRVSATGPTWIEWAWDAVDGAGGYEAQFSADDSFTDEDPTFLKTAEQTSHRVENLAGATSGNFRVRAVVGSGDDAERSDWSASVSGMTDASGPAPGPTPLATPGNLRSTDRDSTSIDLAWNSVPNADGYEIEQREDGESAWSTASCSGSDNLVDGTSCEVTGLDRGTSYDFRVRALPEQGTDLGNSEWAETSSAISTTGTAAAPPASTGEGDLNVTWSTTGTAITWYWEQVEDRTVEYETAIVDGAVGEAECPDGDSADWTSQNGATRQSADVTAGGVRLLCVRTNTDDGPSAPSFAWATIPVDLGAATANDNAAGTSTTSISVAGVVLNPGFSYDFRQLITSVSDASFAAGDCKDGTALDAETTDITVTLGAYRITNLASYTRYGVCYRAETDAGESAWQLTETGAVTLPGAPPSPRAVDTSLDAGSTDLEWTVASRGRDDIPRSGVAANYEFKVLVAAANGRNPVVADCSTPGDGVTEQRGAITSTNTQDGFDVTAVITAPSTAMDYALCVQAKLDGSNRVGPWAIGQEIRIAAPSS